MKLPESPSRMVVIFAFLSLFAGGVSQASVDESLAAMAKSVEGVRAISEPGVVGFVAVWGDRAMPLVLGRSGDQLLPVAGAGETPLGGRVAALAHDYAGAGALQRHDTARWMAALLRWTAGEVPNAPTRVGLFGGDGAEVLRAQGLVPVVMERGREGLSAAIAEAGVTTVLCGRTDLSDDDVEVLLAFVDGGGGFVGCSCPWGWAQVRRRPVSAHPFGPILARGGLALADGYAGGTVEGGFAIGGAEQPAMHGASALTILLQAAEAAAMPPRRTLRQASHTMQLVAEAMPREDLMLRPRLEQVRAEYGLSVLPTPERGLGRDDGLARLLLSLDLSEREAAHTNDVKAHPAAAFFPGPVPDEAPRVTRRVRIDPRVPDWHSTALYAAPGERLRVRIIAPSRAREVAALGVRIGAHTDEIWHLPTWHRVPRLSRSWPIDAESGEAEIASPFGGLVYIDVTPQGGRAGRNPEPIDIEVSGAVEAIFFRLGETDPAAWRRMVEAAPAPWAELACDGLVLTVPAEIARAIDDPAPLMAHWQRVMDACADLATIPRQRPRPERIVTDVQISAGYMHAGYPIMTHLDAASFMTCMQGVIDHGWGPYHEIGHNHQAADWTFDGTIEVTVNLFTLYVFEAILGIRPHETGRVLTDETLRTARAHIEAGAPFGRWKEDPFLALEMYAFMIRDFGWASFKSVFAEYRDLPRNERPHNDDAKRDQWMVRYSRTVGRDLGPYFERWGVPTSEAARSSINDLPVWVPAELVDLMHASGAGG